MQTGAQEIRQWSADDKHLIISEPQPSCESSEGLVWGHACCCKQASGFPAFARCSAFPRGQGKCLERNQSLLAGTSALMARDGCRRPRLALLGPVRELVCNGISNGSNGSDALGDDASQDNAPRKLMRLRRRHHGLCFGGTFGL